MNRRSQLICAWCGPVFCLVFGIGMVPLAGFIPPPTAHDTPAQVVELYTQHHDRLVAGLVLMMASTTLIAPWVGAISTQLKRIEGSKSPLTYGQLGAGAAQIVIVLQPVLIMIVASFRPGRDPALTQALNDLAWIPFVIAFPPIAAQMAMIALAIFSHDAQRVFPRWLAYFNLWCAILLLPAMLLPFFTHGAFAWHGIFEFWLAAIVFFGWVMVMSVSLIRMRPEDDQ